MRATLLLGALVLALTEGLGALGWLAPGPVLAAWGLAGLAAAWLVRRRGGWKPPRPHMPEDGLARALWIPVGLSLSLTLLTGLLAAPNAWDALTYHLPRVERWVEQGTLAFWPTAVDRQLWMSPWAEYATLQLRLLTGGDRLAMLPSWLSFLGCVLLSARIARLLGATDRQAAAAALAAATIPVAVLHASSTQTDLPVAFWVLAAAALVLEAVLRREKALDLAHAGWLGLAAGLAVATKGTAWLALLPWLLLYAVVVARAGGWRALVRPALVGTLLVLGLNAPQFARNLALFGNPLGDARALGFLRLNPVTPGAALANLTANLSLNLGLPWAAWNARWTEMLLALQQSLFGVDADATFRMFGGFRVSAFSTHETVAGNPAHFLAGCGLALWVVSGWRRRPAGTLGAWLAAGFAAALLHATLIRWQPFGARLQLASLVWLAPGLAMAIRGRRALVPVCAALTLAAMPALLENYLRPLLPVGGRTVITEPREAQYFAERPALRSVLGRAVDDVHGVGCSDLGLVAGYDAPEYLIRILARRTSPTLRLRYLEPSNASAALSDRGTGPPPCAVLVLSPPPNWKVPAAAAGMQARWIDGPAALLLPPGANGAASAVTLPPSGPAEPR